VKTRRSLAILFVIVFVDLLGFGMVIPVMALYAERLGAPDSQIGWLMTGYSAMQFVFTPIWGRLSDRLGRRPLLLLSIAMTAVAFFGYALAPTFGWLLVSRLFAGAATANIAIAQAYIADVTPPEGRARGMGLIGAAFGLGMVIGPAIGGGLSLLGPRIPECFAAALCLANVAIAVRRLPESLAPDRRRARAFRHPLSPSSLREAVARPGAAALFAVFFFVTLGFAVLEGTFSLAAAHRYGYSAAQVDGLWLYMGAVAVLVQGWLVGRLARRVPERALIIAGTVALGTGFLSIPFASAATGLLAALALVVGGQGLASPSLSSLISKTVDAPVHGEVLGVSQSLSAGARVIGPVGGGFVLHRFDTSSVFFVAAACAAAALAFGAIRTPAVAPAEEAVRVRRSG
jgi:DHA1 family tetracycline resistance protein-like MFS transporter